MKLITYTLLCASLVGCQPNSNVAPAASSTAASAPTKKDATAEQWRAAVENVFDRVSVQKLRRQNTPEYVIDPGETDPDGITKFFACFDKSPPNCQNFASGKRDGFRKSYFFEYPGLSLAIMANKPKSSLDSYIFLRDCDVPVLVLNPVYRGSDWLYLRRLSIMADENLIVDQDLEKADVKRDVGGDSVTESVNVLLTNTELDSYRRLLNAKKVIIRLTGKNAYETLDPSFTSSFVSAAERLIKIHDAFEAGLKNVSDVKDETCPK